MDKARLCYRLSDEQALLQETISDFLRDRYGHAERAKIIASADGWSPAIWASFADLGVLGLLFGDADGGLDGGGRERLLVMQSLGAALVVEPFFPTCILGGALLRRSASPMARALRKAIVAGHARIAVAWQEPHARVTPMPPATTARKTDNGYRLDGRKALVIGAPVATHLLVIASADDAAGIAVFIVDPTLAGIARRDYRTIDGVRSSDIQFTNVALGPDTMMLDGAVGADAMHAMMHEAIAGLAGESVGIMQRALRDTLIYAHQRRQFGATLAEFQALQHRMADMATATAQAEAMAFHAAAVDWAERENDDAMSAVKLFVDEALRFVTQSAVQIHGAVGMTDELPIGHMFLRATAIQTEFGSAAFHLTKLTDGNA